MLLPIIPVLTLLVGVAIESPEVLASSAYLSGGLALGETGGLDETEGAEEPPGWEGSVTAGASATDGNTDITKASATADASRKNDEHKYTLGLTWNFSEEAEVINQRKTYGKAQYDRFFSEDSYWLLQASGESDKLANVDLRTTVGFGAGRQLYDTDSWKASAEVGVTWFKTTFSSDGDEDYMAARIAYKWDWSLNERWQLAQNAQIFPSIEEDDDVYSKLDTRAKAVLGEAMFAQVQWVLDWDNTPASGAERVDNLYLLTVGWSF